MDKYSTATYLRTKGVNHDFKLKGSNFNGTILELLNGYTELINEKATTQLETSSSHIGDIVGSALLEDILREQKEIICSPRRNCVISADSVKKVFKKYGIVWTPPF